MSARGPWKCEGCGWTNVAYVKECDGCGERVDTATKTRADLVAIAREAFGFGLFKDAAAEPQASEAEGISAQSAPVSESGVPPEAPSAAVNAPDYARGEVGDYS